MTGCVEINARELVDPVTEYLPYETNNYYLQIQATFTETSTGVKLKENARSPNMVEKSKTMSFTNIPQKFKPGFPITFKVSKLNYIPYGLQIIVATFQKKEKNPFSFKSVNSASRLIGCEWINCLCLLY